MPKFMKQIIEKYDDVRGDGNCGYRVIAKHIGLGEQNWLMVRKKLITELEAHKYEYLKVFGGEHLYNYILNGLHPPVDINSFAPMDKWLTFSDMDHIIATSFNMVVVELTRVDTTFQFVVNLQVTRMIAWLFLD